MKLLIASDIHGSAYCALMAQIEAESPDTVMGPSLSAKRPIRPSRPTIVVLLGTFSQVLPRDYAPKEVLAMLNTLADRVVAVRGNCDSEVDQMVLDFPCMADYAIVMDAVPAEGSGGQPALKTQAAPAVLHAWPPVRAAECAADCARRRPLYGHTHVKEIASRDGVLFVNPGSVSLPKDGSNSYAIYENGTFELRELVGG